MAPEPSAASEHFEQIPAAQYVRMSTEHQKYSTAFQMAAIRDYALARKFKVVRTYVDEAKSGLVLTGRLGLQALLRDVIAGGCGFKIILVYDISRWGRFQDTDESAHYEFLCRRAGVQVRYCAESFENDGSPMASAWKALKRGMAAEYSRDLSGKVFLGQCQAVLHGFHHGSMASYGLRRLLVDENRKPRCVLKVGQRKFASTDHVLLIPGPAEEVETVGKIFRWFVEDRIEAQEICNRLNSAGSVGPLGGPWRASTVRHMLRNETYIGTCIYGQTSKKLQGDRKHNPPSEWIRREGAFEAIVDPTLFRRAQAILAEPPHKQTNEELLERLRAVCAHEGRISEHILRRSPGLPCMQTLRNRFGGTAKVYDLLGIEKIGPYRFADQLRLLRRVEQEAMASILAIPPEVLRVSILPGQARVLKFARDLSLRIVAAQPSRRPTGEWFWTLMLKPLLRGDWNLVVRPDVETGGALDYFLFPRWGFSLGCLLLEREPRQDLKAQRHETLADVIEKLPQVYRMKAHGWRRPMSSKYDPLQRYLADQEDDLVEMTFDEIIQVIGDDLPASAHWHVWWGNGRVWKTRNTQAKAWMGAGFVAQLRYEDEMVIFRRMNELQLALTRDGGGEQQLHHHAPAAF